MKTNRVCPLYSEDEQKRSARKKRKRGSARNLDSHNNDEQSEDERGTSFEGINNDNNNTDPAAVEGNEAVFNKTRRLLPRSKGDFLFLECYYTTYFHFELCHS
jgi:hypothetical protein